MVGKLLETEKPVAESTVSQWKTGKAMPDAITLLALATVLDQPVEWLVYGIGNASVSTRSASDVALDLQGVVDGLPVKRS